MIKSLAGSIKYTSHPHGGSPWAHLVPGCLAPGCPCPLPLLSRARSLVPGGVSCWSVVFQTRAWDLGLAERDGDLVTGGELRPHPPTQSGQRFPTQQPPAPAHAWCLEVRGRLVRDGAVNGRRRSGRWSWCPRPRTLVTWSLRPGHRPLQSGSPSTPSSRSLTAREPTDYPAWPAVVS